MKQGIWVILLLVIWMTGACTIGTSPTTKQILPTSPPGGSPSPAVGNESPLPSYPAASRDTVPLPAYPVGAGTAPTASPDVGPQWTAQAIREATAEAELQATLQATPSPEPVLTPVSQGVLLREVWSSPRISAKEKPLLLYSSRNRATGQYTFWQVPMNDINQRVRIFDISSSPLATEIYGQMSPDGQWIAYLLGSNNQHTLRVVQTDGINDHKVSDGLGGGNGRGFYRFMWSPDSTKIVFQRAESAERGFVQHIYVYNLTSNRPPTRVAEIPGAELTGWQNQDTILTVIFTGEQLQWETISVIDGQRKVLAPFPLDNTIMFRVVSPDYQKVLIDWKRGATSILDTTTLQMTPVDLSANQVLWGAASQTLLEIPFQADRPASIVNIDQPEQGIKIALMPAHTQSSRFRAKSVSPDGNYVVIDEMRNSTFAGTHIYDVTANQWFSLSGEPTSIQVLGWLIQQ